MGKVGPDQGKTDQYFQSVGNSQVTLSVSYNSAECTDQGGPEYIIDEAACNRFLGRAVDGCNTDTTTAKYGGIITDHCGVFSLTTRNIERFKCGGSGYNG